MSEDPDPEREQRHARERQHERTESVENILGKAGKMLGEHKYPATSEELAAEYGDQPLDLGNETENLGNETESLGSVFDRLVDERFESADEAREAIYGEITGDAGGPEEYNDERDLAELDENVTDDEPNVNSN